MAAADPRRIKDDAATALDKGRYKKALECYLQLEGLEPRDGAWSRKAGDMWRRLGDEQAAIPCFLRAAERYASAGFTVKAIAACKLVLQVDESHAPTRERIAALNAQLGISAGRSKVSVVPPRVGSGASIDRQAEAAATESLRQPESASPPPPPPGPPRIELAPDAALEALPLVDVVAGARPVPTLMGEGPSGITEIPIELNELELIELSPDDVVDENAIAVLRQTPLFSQLDADALTDIVAAALVRELSPGELVFREGDRGNELFVVVDGEVAVVSEGPPRVSLATLGEGEFFGEVGLLSDAARTASVEARTQSTVLALGREVLRALLDREPAVLTTVLRFVRERLIHRLMATNALFAPFGAGERAQLAKQFRFLEVEPGAVLICEGKRAPGLYVILSGRVEVRRGTGENERRLATLAAGEMFGEMSLLGQKPAIATIRATCKCFVLELPATTFREVIMTHPQVLMIVSELAAERTRALEAMADGAVDYSEGRVGLV